MHAGNTVDKFFLGASIRQSATGWNSVSIQVGPAR